MESPLIVAFLTCNRLEYSKRTLSSFFEFNENNKWMKFYADDASSDPNLTRETMESFGFKNLVQHEKREGISKTTSDLIDQIGKREGSGTVLILQNDFECARPIPLEVVETLFNTPRVGWIRMGGKWKDYGVTPMMDNWIPHCFPPTKWATVIYGQEEVEIGRSFFCYCPPPLIPIKIATQLIVGSRRELEAAERSSTTKYLVARFMKNVFYHFGEEKTPGTIK